MPRYDYEKDGVVKEMIFQIGTAPDEIDGWKRIVGGCPSVQFKGDGWAKVVYEHSAKDYARVKKVDWDQMAKQNNVM